ncbi:MAG: PAS domain S-box protein [Frankiaceae bacterium]|nr:PAS domain S-box protein [Frankiaceae bacterium]
MPTGLRRLVLSLVAAGVVTQAVVAFFARDVGAVTSLDGRVPWAHGLVLLGVLLALTVIGDLVSVRVRHGDQSEELTLFEAAVVVDVLLLPAGHALLVPVAASILCSLFRRRELVKTVFNAANQALATAVLVAIVHVLSGSGSGVGLSGRAVLALLVGTLAFSAVNLIALSRVYGLLGGDDPWEMVRDDARLAAVMAVGMVALGGTAVTVAWAAPALLPFTVVPAAALTFAYRAAAQETEERQRSSQLLALSQVLAGRLNADDVTGAFLDLTRQAFAADVAIAVLDPGAQPGGSVPSSVVDDREGGYERRTSDIGEQMLLLRSSQDGVLALTEKDNLPKGWARAVVAPLEAEGRRLGAVVLATRDRHQQLGRRELTLLTPLASALAVALRGAAHVQRLTEETSKLKAVVDQSSDGILVLDGEGRVQLWSPALEVLTGRPELAALGRPLGQLVATLRPDGTPVDPFTAGRELLSPDQPRATVELTVLRDDGEQRVVRCAHAGAFSVGGTLQRDVVIVHDVTRERQVERLKADFIATVSHELRTPITPIKGYADLLRRRGDAMSPEKRAECLEIISSRTEHLARLVEDLLLASRISATEGAASAQVEMGTADLVALITRACGDFGTDGERIELDLPAEPVHVGCDPMRVVQVLSNLVSNALKYSADGSQVDVRLSVTGGRATVEIADVGRGIPADQLERVFDKFHRVEDPMRMTTGGTGLGLYIARELANAMGATLECRSTLGVGSVFSVSLPVIAPPAAQTPSSGGDAVEATGEPGTLPRPRLVPAWEPLRATPGA